MFSSPTDVECHKYSANICYQRSELDLITRNNIVYISSFDNNQSDLSLRINQRRFCLHHGATTELFSKIQKVQNFE